MSANDAGRLRRRMTASPEVLAPETSATAAVSTSAAIFGTAATACIYGESLVMVAANATQ
jgi:hypothetical protein